MGTDADADWHAQRQRAVDLALDDFHKLVAVDDDPQPRCGLRDWPGGLARRELEPPAAHSLVVEQLPVARNIARLRREAAGTGLEQRDDQIVERAIGGVGRAVDECLLGEGSEADTAARPGLGGDFFRLAEDLPFVGAGLDQDADLVVRVNMEIRALAGPHIDSQHHDVVVAEDRPVICRLLDRNRLAFVLRQHRMDRCEKADDKQRLQQIPHGQPPLIAPPCGGRVGRKSAPASDDAQACGAKTRFVLTNSGRE